MHLVPALATYIHCLRDLWSPTFKIGQQRSSPPDSVLPFTHLHVWYSVWMQMLLSNAGKLTDAQRVSAMCDDLPIPTLFFLSLLLSPVLNMTLNCINYALCFMSTTDTWNEALVKIPWYRYNSWTWIATYNSRTIKVHGPPLPTRRLRKVRLPTTRKDAN